MIRTAVCHFDSAGGNDDDRAARSARCMIGLVDRLISCSMRLVPRYGLKVVMRGAGVAAAAGSINDAGVGRDAAGAAAATGVLRTVLMAVVALAPVVAEAGVVVHVPVAAVPGVIAAGRRGCAGVRRTDPAVAAAAAAGGGCASVSVRRREADGAGHSVPKMVVRPVIGHKVAPLHLVRPGRT